MDKIYKIAEISEIRKSKVNKKEYKVVFFGPYVDENQVIQQPHAPICIWRDFDVYRANMYIRIDE